MYSYNYAVVSHGGSRRRENEDAFYIDGLWRKDVSVHEAKHSGACRDRLTAMVCDGMGGQDAGEVASWIAVKTAAELASSGDGMLFADGGARFIQSANDGICRYMDAHGMDMGSTLAALEFNDGAVTAVNLGDSRCYRLREGRLEQLSTDHSVIGRMLASGQITPEQAQAHPRRHEITQYLGIRSEDMVLEPAVKPGLPVCLGDRYLICSDGLTEALDGVKIEEILGRRDALEAAEALLAAALEYCAEDNVTVIVIQVGACKEGLFQRIGDTLRRWQHGI